MSNQEDAEGDYSEPAEQEPAALASPRLDIEGGNGTEQGEALMKPHDQDQPGNGHGQHGVGFTGGGGEEVGSGAHRLQRQHSVMSDLTGSQGSSAGRDRRNRKRSFRQTAMQKEIPPKPYASNFQQQTMKQWRPDKVSAAPIVACLFVVAFLSVLIGAFILVGNDSVTEIVVRYDDIHEYGWNTAQKSFTFKNTTSLPGAGPGFPQKTFVAANATSEQGVRTVVTFTVPKDVTAEMDLFYGVTEFYQNQRKYRQSRSLNQMYHAIDDIDIDDLVECIPYRSPGDEQPASGQTITIEGTTYHMPTIQYSPCGLGPWSLFNDSFEIYQVDDLANSVLSSTSTASGLVEGDSLQEYIPDADSNGGVRLICNTSDFVAGDGSALLGQSNYSSKGGATSLNAEIGSQCTKAGIAWYLDTEELFNAYPGHLPHIWHSNSVLNSSDNAFYNNRWYNREAGHKLPNVKDEDFMVWMRVAPLPTMRKVFRRFPSGLKAGTYVAVIREYFDTVGFGGKKTLVLSDRSWFGGKGNTAVALGFICIGALAFVLFLAIGLRALLRSDASMQTRAPTDGNDE